MKRIHVTNVNASTTTTMAISVDAVGFDKTLYREEQMMARKTINYEEWLVLPPGAEIAIANSAAVGVNYWISGTELEGVAD